MQEVQRSPIQVANNGEVLIAIICDLLAVNTVWNMYFFNNQILEWYLHKSRCLPITKLRVKVIISKGQQTRGFDRCIMFAEG